MIRMLRYFSMLTNYLRIIANIRVESYVNKQLKVLDSTDSNNYEHG